ncbi:hypothetical protein PSTT_04165 [Puccinia striiformis]|uniref:Uncharacterized protein n=1 Tax=Puccinia striiformis TaxID=27350 RepID=A0A2S4VTY4_9BASI|nr:hypothetical protein PSTT_04165 [Puccinia striiformis]
MREFTKTSTTCSIKMNDIVATLNLQHNCHNGKCTIEKTKMTRIERQETNVEEHQQMANLSVGEIDTEDIVTAMAQGHLNWKSHCRKTMPCKKKKVGKKMVDMTSDLPLPPNPTICLTMHLSWEKGFTNMATVEQRVMGGLCWSSFCATGPLTPRWV